MTIKLARLAALGVLAASGTAGAEGLPTFNCLIEPFEEAEVSSPVAGVLERVGVERGDTVSKGQVLAALRSDVERASVELARARTRMDAEVSARKESLAFAERKLERVEELYKKNGVSFQDRDEAQTDARLARLALTRAEQDLAFAAMELKRAQVQLQLREIPSPIDGVVVDVMLSPGESVEDRPIVKLAQIDPLSVEVIVPVAYFGRIDKGMRATVEPESPVGGRYDALVTVVDRVVDAASGTFGVRLELPNPDQSLPGGLRCSVRFHDS